jgi:hypothetical protein
MKGLTFAWMLAVAVCGLRAQQLPPRDAEVKPTFGTSSVSGVVVTDEEQPRPVRRAIVTLSGSALRPSRGAITDDHGRFALEDLPAGLFTLTAARASFITSAYGAKRPGRPGTPIAAGEGQHVDGLFVTLWRGAAIAGAITDETGAPVPGIPVTAIPARAGGARLLTLSNNPTTTDERGEFRIFGLEPGTYLVSAKPMTSGGGPMTAPSEAEVDALLAAVRRGDAAPPPPASSQPAAALPKPFTYAPVFYPGTSSVTGAAAIPLKAGQEAIGLDFSLQRASTSIVEGVVSRPDGLPAARATLQLTAAMPPGPFAELSPVVINATAGPDGTFRITQVTPGDYKLVATAPASAAAPRVDTGVVRPGNVEPALWAQADVSVAGIDVIGLAVRLEPGMTIAGKVVFEGGTKPMADLTKIQVWFKPPNLPTRPGVPINSLNFVTPVSVRANGTFEILNVIPGTYQPSVSLSGSDAAAWWPKSAMLGERDLLEGLIEIARDAPTSLVVTLSDRRTELSGFLQAASGAPASDVLVIAYAADRKFWVPSARRVQAVRPDADGRYVIRDLPAGEYLVTAVTDVDQDEWQDPALLDKLVAASAKVTIAEGEKKVLDVRLGVG